MEDKQASTYILCALARLLLTAHKIAECKETLLEAAAYMEDHVGVESTVQSAYYRAWTAYYKIKGPAHEFYKNALLLLAYQPLCQMSQEDALTISFDLGIAALVGEALYNFGELLEHPVLRVLQETEYSWLAHMLRAFNAGDISQYEALVTQHHSQLEAQPALLANSNFLKEKITLMCLAETLFKHIGPSAKRTAAFADIAVASKLPLEQVELLLMRALSLGLIRGLIDEVDRTIRVDWVQPRVLQTSQISSMAEQLKTWMSTVDSTLQFLHKETPEFTGDGRELTGE
jgi:26S proteasome regulatory subunit N9